MVIIRVIKFHRRNSSKNTGTKSSSTKSFSKHKKHTNAPTNVTLSTLICKATRAMMCIDHQLHRDDLRLFTRRLILFSSFHRDNPTTVGEGVKVLPTLGNLVKPSKSRCKRWLVYRVNYVVGPYNLMCFTKLKKIKKLQKKREIMV